MSTIKTLIFDFGDVFINLDKEGALNRALELFELETLSEEITSINCLYEQGFLSTDEFLDFYLENFPELTKQEVVEEWNSILRDFPRHRLEFIKKLAEEKKYKLILLSNTNELHIDWIKDNVLFYEEFKACFDAFYLSHEIQLRKPDADIFKFVLSENNIKAEECLFIDDTEENTTAAKPLGFNAWNINPEIDDVTELFSKIKL